MLDNIKQYQDFKAMDGLAWPNDICKAAFSVKGSPLKANKEADLVLACEVRVGNCPGPNEELNKKIRVRYSEVEDIEGKVGAITVTTRVMNGEGSTVERTKWVIKVESEGGEGEWFNSLVKLNELVVRGGRSKLALYPPGTEKNERRMLECIFRNTGVKCLVYTKSQQGTSGGPSAGISSVNRSRARDTEALIFRKEGQSYAELLKTFKEKVKPETPGARPIRTIREARDGSVIVVLNDNRASNELQTELTKSGDLKFRRMAGGNEETLYINEIDGVTTKEEVVEALSAATGEVRENIRVENIS